MLTVGLLLFGAVLSQIHAHAPALLVTTELAVLFSLFAVGLRRLVVAGRPGLADRRLVLVVRPLSVMAVVRRGTLTRHQRRLVAWFGTHVAT